MATLGLSKVFILDKYFTELQKFWETERKLQDASSSNEAVHLQQRLKSLSTELVTLRNKLHVGPASNPSNVMDNNVIQSENFHNINFNPHSNNFSNNINNDSNNNNTNMSNIYKNNITKEKPEENDSSANNKSNNEEHNNNNTTNSNYNNISSNCNDNVNNESSNNHNGSTSNISNANNSSNSNNISSINNNENNLEENKDETNNNNIKPRNILIPHPLPHDIVDEDPCFNNKPFNDILICNSMNENMMCDDSSSITDSSNVDDLIHLMGPLTEDAVIKALQTRFGMKNYFTNVGPILLSINPYHDVGNPLTLSSTRTMNISDQLKKIVHEAVRQQAETGYPQAIILSGASGSGKTHCSMLLLRQLFAVAGGGPETDAFKHLAAAFTVLRSLGSAKTSSNIESSRIGQFIEVQVTDGALYRTKIHCYFLDQTRVIRQEKNEKNYHIFYQMLAGLSEEERFKLNLDRYSVSNLQYLSNGDTQQDVEEDTARFQAWKTCLGVLGIPFLDVVRVLAAVLLLGNTTFVDSEEGEVFLTAESELKSIANLLGVSDTALFKGLTTRTRSFRDGQIINSTCNAKICNVIRDSLAKALYCRTVATIVRRANSLKRLGSTLGTLSSDSNESVHNQIEVASHHTSVQGGNAGSKSMAALNNAVRHVTDGFIGILDMFGFEKPKMAHLEHLCINLCAETMQHFYNTHIFKSSIESCRDEGIVCETEIDYVDNVPCIDLISSLRTGLLSMLDNECSFKGNAASYLHKIKEQHRESPRLEIHNTDSLDQYTFVIKHFAGKVEYDTSEFLETNRDVIPDDLVAVFYKHTCNFGFATHLFGSELKALYSKDIVPRGLNFRIAPTSHTDLLNRDEPVSTLTQDFHTRLDNLLRTLVHARPHFVRCVRSNFNNVEAHFDKYAMICQIRALQVLETVNLMASGFPHRTRFRQFLNRYKMLVSSKLLVRTEDKILEDCKLILGLALEKSVEVNNAVLSWAPGKKHIFLSEGMRQCLENMRSNIRNKSAIAIQSLWRGWRLRCRLGISKHATVRNQFLCISKMPSSQINPVNLLPTNKTMIRPRPQPITGTPPPEPNEKCDSKVVQKTCNLFGIDLERPPPVPPSRSYTVTGNSKLGYPQVRLMKMNFPEHSQKFTGEQLRKGEMVTVVGASNRRGHLIVERNAVNIHVPYQYMEIVKGPPIAPFISNKTQIMNR